MVESNTLSGAIKEPLSFSLMQNKQFVFLQINLDKKEFDATKAEPELVITPENQTSEDDPST